MGYHFQFCFAKFEMSFVALSVLLMLGPAEFYDSPLKSCLYLTFNLTNLTHLTLLRSSYISTSQDG